MLAKNFGEDQIQYSTSGGTTGVITKFAIDNASLSPKHAAILRFDKWTGWDLGEWMGLIWPATLDNIHNKKPLKK